MSSDKKEAVGEFVLGIRARRGLLQTLFYSTRNSSRDAWAFHRRLEDSSASDKSFFSSVIAIFMHSSDKTVAEQTAQDSAWALMLILDYALQRFADSIELIDTREFGPTLQSGVRLSKAIWALANQARHLHEWMQTPMEKLEENPSVKVIRALQHDPLNPNVAREVIAYLPYESYIDFEEAILEIARDALLS